MLQQKPSHTHKKATRIHERDKWSESQARSVWLMMVRILAHDDANPRRPLHQHVWRLLYTPPSPPANTNSDITEHGTVTVRLPVALCNIRSIRRLRRRGQFRLRSLLPSKCATATTERAPDF